MYLYLMCVEGKVKSTSVYSLIYFVNAHRYRRFVFNVHGSPFMKYSVCIHIQTVLKHICTSYKLMDLVYLNK